jgi:hypothetical protein
MPDLILLLAFQVHGELLLDRRDVVRSAALRKRLSVKNKRHVAQCRPVPDYSRFLQVLPFPAV